MRRRFFRLAIAACAALLPAGASGVEIRPELLLQLEQEAAPFFVVLEPPADLAPARQLPTKEAMGRYVHAVLTEAARDSQEALVADLVAQGVEHEAFWIVNTIRVHGDRALAERLARRTDVARIVPCPKLRRMEPAAAPEPATASGRAIEWNISHVNAPQVWNQGVTGEGVTVAALDTGVQWDHPALIEHYRGWNGVTADHDYAWWDAVHATADSCGPDTPAPCDIHGHGTHVTGTMCGDDGGANRIGIAPGAEWIHCRIYEPVLASDLSYALECLQWMLAPTERDGSNPDPSRAPHVLSNSWICEPHEGCTDPDVLRPAVAALRAAGIVVVAGAGNNGPGCSTIMFPPGIYETVVTVGATDFADQVTGFSSRGPVTIDGSNRLEPDLVAPGLDVRSSFLHDTYFVWAGTSMATPHVAGLVALIISANPALAGQVETIEQILIDSAQPFLLPESCGGYPGGQVPNPFYGWGRIDAWQAYQLAIATSVPEIAQAVNSVQLSRPAPNPTTGDTTIRFSLAAPSSVTLDVVDVRGRLVRRLLDGATRPAGAHELVWNGRDEGGAAVASGAYFLHIRAGGARDTGRLILSRR